MKTNSKIIAGTIVVVIAALFIYFYESANSDSDVDNNSGNNAVSDSDNSNSTSTASTSSVVDANPKYKDGIYKITQSYISPGGKQSIGVSLTLAADKITSATVTNGGTDGDSKSYQNFFISNFSNAVVGNLIDNLNLNVTAGASLTTGAFNAALAKIRKEAML